MIEINSQSEMEKYYVEEKDAYIFNDDVVFNCNIDVEKSDIRAKKFYAWDIKAFNIYADVIEADDIKAGYIIAKDIHARDIIAYDIKARDIIAYDIKARDIIAYDIKANDIYACDINAFILNANNISYYAICIAYESFKCKKIEGRYKNTIHKCLNNDIEFIDDEE